MEIPLRSKIVEVEEIDGSVRIIGNKDIDFLSPGMSGTAKCEKGFTLDGKINERFFTCSATGAHATLMPNYGKGPYLTTSHCRRMLILSFCPLWEAYILILYAYIHSGDARISVWREDTLGSGL